MSDARRDLFDFVVEVEQAIVMLTRPMTMVKTISSYHACDSLKIFYVTYDGQSNITSATVEC